MTRIIAARADRVSAAEFAALFAPRPSPLRQLVGQLWEAARRNDREEIARLHKEIADLSLVEVEEIKPGSIAA